MSEPLLDLMILDELERRLGRERVLRVVAAQMANGRELLRRISALEISPEPALVKTLAHQIAGSSGSVGLRRLGEQAALLERTASDAALPALALRLRDLRHCMEASQAALRAEFPET